MFRDPFPDPPRVLEGSWRSISLGKVEANSGGSVFVQHRCGVRTDGTLWCWGNNSDGQLGIPAGGEPRPFESAVQVGTDTDWADVSVGRAHTCGLREDGRVECFGASGNGQLGSQTGAVCVPSW